jgi:hypothetical protein
VTAQGPLRTGSVAVRAARYSLAHTLLDHRGDPVEARQQLTLALDEDGGNPADWEIHLALARAWSQEGDRTTTLSELLHVLREAPETELEAPATEALSLLEDDPSLIPGWLTGDELRPLVVRALERTAPSALVRLAARLSISRDDTDSASTLAESRPADVAELKGTLTRKQAIATVHRLIDQGRPAEALDVVPAEERAASGDDMAAALALALYAARRPSEALAMVEGRPGSFEVAIVRALVLLQQAAEAGMGDERRALARRALDTATAAVRLAPGNFGSLLRAEAMLEGALDLSEGRQLLIGALRRLDKHRDQGLAELRWWRVQEKVRDDEIYRYFQVEVAAAKERYDEVISLGKAMTTARTEYLHDGAALELQAVAWRHKGDAAGAARCFEQAAEQFKNAHLQLRAAEASRAAAEASPTVQRTLNLAQMLWESTFPVEPGTEANPSAVEEGLRALDTVDSAVTGDDAIRACYLRGLLLERLPAEPSNDLQLLPWRPIPFLLVSSLGQPGASYPAAHLAWALNRARLILPARLFADLALAREREDPWLIETAIIARFTWSGMLDEDTRRLLSKIDNDSWHDSILAFDCLMTGDYGRLESLLDRITWDAFWARQIHAYATAKCLDYSNAVPLLAELLGDALDASDADAAIEAALMLGNLDSAREQIDRQQRKGTPDPHSLMFNRALLGVVEGQPGAAEWARDLLLRSVRPALLRYVAQVTLPTLSEAFAEEPGVVHTLDRLELVARTCLAQMPADPPLLVELDADHARCQDARLEATIRALLQVAQLIAADDRREALRLAKVRPAWPEDGRSAFDVALSSIVELLGEPAGQGTGYES